MDSKIQKSGLTLDGFRIAKCLRFPSELPAGALLVVQLEAMTWGQAAVGKTPVEGWLFGASVCSMFSGTVKQSTGWWYTSEKYEFVSWDD